MAGFFIVQPVLAQQPSPVRVDEVRVDQLQQHRQVTGNIRAVTRSRIATIEPGRVLELDVEEGQYVEAGQPIAVIDDARLQIELRRIEANLQMQNALLAERQAQVELRESDLELMKSLQQRGAVNPKEVNDASLELAVAQAQHLQAERSLDVLREQAALLRQRISDTSITAPFDGLIVAKLTERGQWVAEGDAIVEIISTGHFDVWLNVPQQFVRAVSRDNLTVMVHVDALGHQFTANHARIVGDIDGSARTFSLVVRIDEHQPSVAHDVQERDAERPRLAAGMSATAWIPTTDQAEQLTVHKDAVMRNDAGPYVYVVRQGSEDEPAHVVPTQVQVLFSLPERLVVRNADLRAGDYVVIEGNERLRPMAAVRVVGPNVEARR
jgi:RND family efflux transporter MFP subunit